ncbi:unnamed protein product [Diplocarpon coronariae]|uniref:Uncharacterized protein n=1 Tax=Diplocarpon coronariae TaxID=2795749 RepID=A0A218Z1T4_9HELO|nr:hypothetical protein JHW43_004267 [Diplocarpon mali]OWP01644.1 hypothetical protein B2J93_2160 [Marssonina coronariae]
MRSSLSDSGCHCADAASFSSTTPLTYLSEVVSTGKRSALYDPIFTASMFPFVWADGGPGKHAGAARECPPPSDVQPLRPGFGRASELELGDYPSRTPALPITAKRDTVRPALSPPDRVRASASRSPRLGDSSFSAPTHESTEKPPQHLVTWCDGNEASRSERLVRSWGQAMQFSHRGYCIANYSDT